MKKKSNKDLTPELISKQPQARTIFSEFENHFRSYVFYVDGMIQCQVYTNPHGYWDAQACGHLVTTQSDTFLLALGYARVGEKSIISDIHGNGKLILSRDNLEVQAENGEFASYSSRKLNLQFDQLFLDTFSVVENGEPRKRTSRDISLSISEKTLINILSEDPNHLHGLDPRSFEVAIAISLKEIGFRKVCLSRFVRDRGVDIYAIYCDGETEETVVIEVKHRNGRSVGLSVVDRLNGVRDRDKVDKGIIFTNSSFSNSVRREYLCKSSVIALIDFEKLTELLKASKANWTMTYSGLWTTPRNKIDL
ncbi:MAG: restriction endonuclease [bacterium]|nr:restriction endonuclease [bacterium]